MYISILLLKEWLSYKKSKPEKNERGTIMGKKNERPHTVSALIKLE